MSEQDDGMTGVDGGAVALRLFRASEGGGYGPDYNVVARDPAHVLEVLAGLGVPDSDDPEEGVEVDAPYHPDAPFTMTCMDETLEEVMEAENPEGADVRMGPSGLPTITATAAAWCAFAGPCVLTCSEF